MALQNHILIADEESTASGITNFSRIAGLGDHVWCASVHISTGAGVTGTFSINVSNDTIDNVKLGRAPNYSDISHWANWSSQNMGENSEYYTELTCISAQYLGLSFTGDETNDGLVTAQVSFKTI